MPPKTLTDWLESSTDESGSGTGESSSSGRDSPQGRMGTESEIPISAESPTAMPKKQTDAERRRQAEAEERRRKQEELKERMRAALGHTAVETVQASAATGHTRRHHRTHSEASDDSMFSNVPSVGQLPPQVPHSARSSVDGGHGGLKKLDPNQLGEDGNGGYGVMVVDQGCQTQCNIETQTDPDPLLISSPQWYHQYYGHTTAPLHGFVPFSPFGGTAMAGHMPMMTSPSAFVPGGPMGGHPLQQPQQPSMMGGGGGLGTQAVSDFRNQLRNVQAAVDGLINKYNLPPPPGLTA